MFKISLKSKEGPSENFGSLKTRKGKYDKNSSHFYLLETDSQQLILTCPSPKNNTTQSRTEPLMPGL